MMIVPRFSSTGITNCALAIRLACKTFHVNFLPTVSLVVSQEASWRPHCGHFVHCIAFITYLLGNPMSNPRLPAPHPPTHWPEPTPAHPQDLTRRQNAPHILQPRHGLLFWGLLLLPPPRPRPELRWGQGPSPCPTLFPPPAGCSHPQQVSLTGGRGQQPANDTFCVSWVYGRPNLRPSAAHSGRFGPLRALFLGTCRPSTNNHLEVSPSVDPSHNPGFTSLGCTPLTSPPPH